MTVSVPDLSDFTPTDDLSRAWTMPARWYTEPAFLEFELRRIFSTTWQPAGRIDMVQQPGDHFTCDVATFRHWSMNS